MIYNQDIKYVSTALLGHVLKYFNDNIKMDYDQQPVLVIYPINPFVLTTALSLGFMPAPNCGCKRKKCTHSTSCITERSNIDTWCPTVKSWQNWIKKAELEPVIF